MRRAALIGVMIAVLVAAVGPAAAQEDECYSKGGIWDPNAFTCTINNSIQVTIDYPIMLTAIPFADDVVNGYLLDARNQFFAAYTSDFLGGGPNPWSLDITYEWYTFSDTVFSLKFNVYEYTGGAHPNTTFQTFTFDQNAGTVVSLDDLFAPDANPWPTIGAMAEQQISAALGDNMVDAKWLHDGSGENPDNYQNFVLTSDTLIFYFPPYQVAAYAAGPQVVSIPLADIQSMLAPAFQP